MINLVYCARPIYGGWISFTAHLSLKYELPLFKIGNRTESKARNFGYGVPYLNIDDSELKHLDGPILITAVDKNYYNHLDKFPNGTYIVIHDPTEVKIRAAEPLLKELHRFKVITIRKSVQDFLKKTYNIKSKYIVHPFYEYDFTKVSKPTEAVSISRIDFDKHTDIILKANKLLKDPIDIYGSINRQYVFFSLAKLNFKKYYKGQFEKSFSELSEILKDAKFVVDMSIIKNDGGGSQYTFLEAIYQECCLIINAQWINSMETPFNSGVNCFVVRDENDLVKVITSRTSIKDILKESKKILIPHITVDWPKEIMAFK